MRRKNLTISFFLVATLFFFSANFSFAKADDLVITDDGGVILYVTNNVLADSTKSNVETKPTAPVSPPAPVKTVPIVPAHTESTIKINPPINNDQKIQVTVTTPAPLQQSGSVSPTKTLNPSSPSINKPPVPQATVVTKTVDQVVAKGAGGQTVFSIKSDKANQLTISQEEVKAKTSLPLQVDSLSHAISVPSSSEGSANPSRVSVLPKEAIQGVVNKGILESKNASNAQVTLTKDASGVNYTVDSVKSGKLFGVFSIKAPDEVQLSAQTGKIVPTPKTTILNFFGRFIK
ncbi:MAG TPA: hypothetical protein VKC89_02920 [Patescibacteria group bacterium]|nr:hypothetical protein [Patescibacteria group bacterium]